MEQIFGRKFWSGRLFWIVVTLVLIMLFIASRSNNLLMSFFTGIAGSITAAYLIAAVLYYCLPEMFRSKVIILSPNMIKPSLNANLKKAHHYYFKGGMGRWIRVVALPKMLEQANRKSEKVIAEIVLLDPKSENSCLEYARDKVAISQQDSKWKVSDIQDEAIVTTYLLLKLQQSNPRFELNLGFQSFYGSYRYDFTERGGVLSKANRELDGIYFPESSALYRTFLEEIHDAFRQSRKLTFTLDESLDLDASLKKIIDFFEIEVSIQRINKIKEEINADKKYY